MKILLILMLASLFTHAQYPSWYEGGTPQYISESALPKGWPQPGPYFKVIKKKYPKYKAAYTNGSKKAFTFTRLLRHIKKQGIPMTSPVEMEIESKGTSLKMKKMGFLYQNKKVQASSIHKKVYEVEVPAQKLISYTWQGCDCEKKQKHAKKELKTYAQVSGIKLSNFRLLGYNSPSIPDDQQTWEMQASIDR